MNESCSPASSSRVAALAVVDRSWRYVVKPVAVTVASSPSSRWATVVV
jgi:hypothetical protein